jgi:hypothetical protein
MKAISEYRQLKADSAPWSANDPEGSNRSGVFTRPPPLTEFKSAKRVDDAIFPRLANDPSPSFHNRLTFANCIDVKERGSS